MIIQVHTDNHVQGGAETAQDVETTVRSVLDRYTERLTRVEVHLSDVNSRHKSLPDPVQCRLEARPAGHQPLAVTADGPTVDQAVAGAARKMEKLLDNTFDRLDDRRG